MAGIIDITSLRVPILGDASQLEREFEKASGLGQKFGLSIQTIGKAALAGGLAGITAAVAGIGAVVSKTLPMASEFRDSIVELDLAAPEAAGSLEELRAAALAVGGDTQVLGASATGAAEAMTGLFKSGVNVDAIMGDMQGYLAGTTELGGALAGAFNLAAASTLDVVAAADFGAIALSTFGGEMEEGKEQADFITMALNNTMQAADASVAEVEDLIGALSMVGPTASQLGMGIEDTNNALALLSTAGIQGTRAGSNLDAMLRSLSDPTKAAKEAFKELGIELFDEQGNFKDLGTIVGEFEGALEGAQEVTTIVGGRTKEQNDLLETAGKRYESLRKRIDAHNVGLNIMSDKALAKANAEMINANDVIFQLSSIQGTAVKSTRELTEEQKSAYLGSIFTAQGQRSMNVLLEQGAEGWTDMAAATEAATSLTERAAAKAATLSGMWEGFQGTLETAGIQIGEVFMPYAEQLLEWAGVLVTEYGPPLIEWIEGAGAALLPLVQQIGNLVLNGGSLSDWLALLPEGMQPVVDGILAFVEAVTPLVEQVVAWLSENVKLQDVLIALGIAISTVIIPAVLSFISFIAPLVLVFALVVAAVVLLRNAWEQNWGDIQGKTQVVIDWLKENIPLGIEAARAAWEDVLLPALTAVWLYIQDNVIPIILDVVAWLQENIPLAIEEARRVWEEVLLPALTTVYEFIRDDVIPIIEDAVAWLQENIPLAIEEARRVWEEVLLPALTTVYEFIRDDVIPIILDVVAWLQENIPLAIEEARRVWEEVLLPALTTVYEFIRDDVIPVIESVVEWLEVNIPAAIEEARRVWEEVLLPALTAVWEFLDEYIFPIFRSLIDILVLELQIILEVLAAVWEETLLPALTTVWEFLDDHILPIFESLIDWLGGESGLVPMMKTVAEYLQGGFLTALGKARDAIEGVADKVGGLLDKIREWRGTDVPEDFKPGSPPPLFYALQAINSEMAKLSDVQLPNLSRALPAMGAGTVGAASLGERMAGAISTVDRSMHVEVNANYANQQSESDVSRDLRTALDLLGWR